MASTLPRRLSILVGWLALINLSHAQNPVGPGADAGLIHFKSPDSVADTADRFTRMAQERGLNVFTRVDHSSGAQSAGLELPPTVVVLFGNPKAGTPLMQCQRTVAIDLPQKALVWQDEMGQTWLSYNDPQYLMERHQLGEGCATPIQRIGQALNGLATAATSPEGEGN
ncbi:MAG: DUF302 domain-containing protein [Candidatus Competibacterales bacterium]